MKLMSTVVLGCCCIVILGSIFLLGAQTIKFTEIGSTNGLMEIDIPVQIVKSPEDLNLNNNNFAAFDWQNHNLIVTKGWKLKRISYSTFQPFSRVKERLVRIVLHEQNDDLTYYYRIKKVDIFLDEHYPNGGVTFK